jgi:hypothetical protein
MPMTDRRRSGIAAIACVLCLAACAGSGDDAMPARSGGSPAPAVLHDKTPYYVEFRARFSPFVHTGHTYLVYGPQRADGKPLERHLISFYPAWGPLGIIVGIVGAPGRLGEGYFVGFPDLAVYRRDLTPADYKRLIDFIETQKNKHEVWKLASNNCNDFAADAARVVGLRAPAFHFVPPVLFVAELGRLNTADSR